MDLEKIMMITRINKILKEVPAFDTYNLCRNHIRSKNLNDVPMLKVDIRSASWDLQDQDMGPSELEMIDRAMWDEFDFLCESIEENDDLEIFTDMNGYRVLLDSDIVGVIEEVYEDIEELENETDPEYIRNYIEDLKVKTETLKLEIEKVNQFLGLEKDLEDWVKDFPKYYKEREAEE